MSRIALMDDDGQGLEFDASMSEGHTTTATTTDHPIEDGADQSDHIRIEPDQLTIRGIVSNHPIIFLASVFARPSVPGGDPASRAQDAFEFLRRTKESRKLVSASTIMRDYTDMAITSITATHEANTGNIADMDVRLKQFLKATTETVAPPAPSNPSRGKSTDKGKQQKNEKPESTQQGEESILSRAASAISGAL